MNRLLELGDFLQIRPLMDTIISDLLLPSLDFDSATAHAKVSIQKVLDKRGDSWALLLEGCLTFIAENTVKQIVESAQREEDDRVN